MANQLCIVLDFGGQYNQLIARRVRECGVYCEIKRFDTPIEEIKAMNPMGIIFTGGPNSVYDETSPHISKEIFEIGVPILGICYGCQLIAYTLGGTVSPCDKSEYGMTDTYYDNNCVLFDGVSELADKATSWMSHTDFVSQIPSGFVTAAHTDNCPTAAMYDKDRKFYAVQFHPEVSHTAGGLSMLDNFLKKVCGFDGDWKMDNFIENTVAKLREQIGDKRVILGLSGGVDSSVAAGLLSRAVGKQLTCVFVDQGLMRKDEGDFVEQTFTTMFDMNFVRVNCGELFMSKLKGVTDPEEKRKIIGGEFIRVFEEEARTLSSSSFAKIDVHSDSRRVQKVQKYISTHYQEDIRLASLADMVGMTPVSFSRFFRLRTGKTLSDYIIDIRLGFATRMLVDSTRTIAEVCYDCGFNNLSNFNRMFKRKKGCSPKEFRENYRKKKLVI